MDLKWQHLFGLHLWMKLDLYLMKMLAVIIDHIKLFSMCVSIWNTKDHFPAEEYGFSPVWLSVYCTKLDFSGKEDPHVSQECCFCSVWGRIWDNKFDLCVQRKIHIFHKKMVAVQVWVPMGQQRWHMRKERSKYFTRKWLLNSVCSHMNQQRCILCKSRSRHFTRIWFLSSVRWYMLYQAWLYRKGRHTYFWIWFLYSVFLHMRH